MGQLLDLAINTIAYVNAHNVIIHKQDRNPRNPRDVDRINRKRTAKGKKPIPSLQPYHWIEVRQSVIEEKKGYEGATLDYREWVRGHFQRYHRANEVVRNWISPYLRGPEDAPWRENRYKILEDMLKRGPKLEE